MISGVATSEPRAWFTRTTAGGVHDAGSAATRGPVQPANTHVSDATASGVATFIGFFLLVVVAVNLRCRRTARYRAAAPNAVRHESARANSPSLPLARADRAHSRCHPCGRGPGRRSNAHKGPWELARSPPRSALELR